MIHFLGNGKQQIVADSNPNLREYCILTRSIERLDMQSLLNPFEETFHLPAFPIELCNGQVGVSEIVTQESIDIVCGIILINNQAERVWIPFGGQRSGKPHDDITYNSSLFVYRSFLQHFILHVVFSSCHKESLLAMEVVKRLLEVNISLVHEIVASWLYGNQVHRLGAMTGCLCQIDEGRYRTTQIQQRVHLYTALVMMQTSPRAELEAQLDGATVKGIYNAVYVKSGWLILVQFSCPDNQNLSEIMVYAPILGLIDMSQSRS